MNYEEGLEHSNEIIGLLFRYCARIEPTGSLRRKESRIDSIEMIASPQLVEADSYWNDGASSLTGEVPGPDRLDAGIRLLERNGALKQVRRLGTSALSPDVPSAGYALIYRQATVVIYTVAPPAQWGVEFVLRTGDDDFVDFIVRKAARMGLALTRGHLERDGETVDTPEEADAMRALGLDWVEPENRNRRLLGPKGMV